MATNMATQQPNPSLPLNSRKALENPFFTLFSLFSLSISALSSPKLGFKEVSFPKMVNFQRYQPPKLACPRSTFLQFSKFTFLLYCELLCQIKLKNMFKVLGCLLLSSSVAVSCYKSQVSSFKFFKFYKQRFYAERAQKKTTNA